MFEDIENVMVYMAAKMSVTQVFLVLVFTNILISYCIFSILLAIYRKIRELMYLPPGPWGLPLVGSLIPARRQELHVFYAGFVGRYGPIYSIRLGQQLCVVISDYRLIKEVFRREDFTDRPIDGYTNILGGYGVINIDGDFWRRERKFLHGSLRHFGMTRLGISKQLMEARIMIEVKYCLCHLKSQVGKPVDTNEVFAVSVSNVICDILMSVRFSYNDEQFRRFMNLINEGFALFGSIALANSIPILRIFPQFNRTLLKIEKNRGEMAKYLQEKIDEHKKVFDPDHPRDILDMYLRRIHVAEQEGTVDNLFDGKDPDRQIQQILGDIFSAGMETIKSSLQWSLLFMLHYPDQMKAVQEELDQIVGRNRLPSLEDLPYLPTTESTIFEILRMSSIVPMGTTHAPTRDIQLGEYVIPKHAQIVPLLHFIHMDPRLWDEPEKFNPSRFINPEGKITKPDFFMPFGEGRRKCLGEIMARMEMFLFFSSIMHSFELSVPEGHTLPSLKGIAGITIVPEPFKVCLKSRPLYFENANLRTNSSSG